MPLPFYGFDEYISVLRHGFNTGGDHERHVKRVAPESHALRARDIQFPHDYSCPQAIRTKIPEEHYSTSYIADETCKFLEARRGNPKPFFLMVRSPTRIIPLRRLANIGICTILTTCRSRRPIRQMTGTRRNM